MIDSSAAGENFTDKFTLNDSGKLDMLALQFDNKISIFVFLLRGKASAP